MSTLVKNFTRWVGDPMIWTVSFLLLLASFIATLVSAAGKCPLWVPVLLLVIVGLLNYLPK